MAEPEPRLAETAFRHLARRVPTAYAEETVAASGAALPGGAYECLEALFVVDGRGRLNGMVALPTLLASRGERTLSAVMTRDPPSVLPETDQERVAAVAAEHGLAAVPVVDAAGTFMGAVPARALIGVLWHEHEEDMHRLAGILRRTDHARLALEVPPLQRVRYRLPWLLVGLFGSLVAAAVVARFEDALTTRVAIAFFIPAIVYLADAIGSQTETVAVRGPSLGRGPLARLLSAELATGATMGLLLGARAALAVSPAYGDLRLALAVGLAILIAGSVATTVGLLLPWLLSRAGLDPAFGKRPARHRHPGRVEPDRLPPHREPAPLSPGEKPPLPRRLDKHAREGRPSVIMVIITGRRGGRTACGHRRKS